MIAATVTTTGPLFERDLAASLLLANVKAGQEVGPLLGRALAAAYGAHRGPGRYGHLADSVSFTTQVSGASVLTEVFPSGKSAFKALFLERGVRAPHKGGRIARQFPKESRDRRARARGHAAALRAGPLFRRSLPSHGAPAFHITDRVWQEESAQVLALVARAQAKALGAA